MASPMFILTSKNWSASVVMITTWLFFVSSHYIKAHPPIVDTWRRSLEISLTSSTYTEWVSLQSARQFWVYILCSLKTRHIYLHFAPKKKFHVNGAIVKQTHDVVSTLFCKSMRRRFNVVPVGNIHQTLMSKNTFNFHFPYICDVPLRFGIHSKVISQPAKLQKK